jgi:hypothetical protein
MSLSALFLGIVAIAKAVPVFKQAIDSFYDFYVTHEINDIKSDEESLKKERKALMRVIADAKTDEDRKALSITLSRILNIV